MGFFARVLTICAVTCLAADLSSNAVAATTVTHNVDFFVVGDDETERAAFENPFLPDRPMELWFDGFAENLADTVNSNGLDVALIAEGLNVTDAVRLPSLVPGDPTPISLHASLVDSPTPIGVEAEGLGCCDNIHVYGTLRTIGQIPEPSAWFLAAVGAAVVSGAETVERTGQ